MVAAVAFSCSTLVVSFLLFFVFVVRAPVIHELLNKRSHGVLQRVNKCCAYAQTFSDRACEMNRELHEYGGLVFNAQQRVRVLNAMELPSEVRSRNRKTSATLPRDTIRILRVQFQIWPRLHDKSGRRRDGRIRNCFRREAFQGREGLREPLLEGADSAPASDILCARRSIHPPFASRAQRLMRFNTRILYPSMIS